MGKAKNLYILLGVLLAVCVAAFAVSRYESHKEEIRTSDEILWQIESDEVTALSWEYGGETLAFHKDGTWIYDGDAAFPVDETQVDAMLEQFTAFGVSFVIENVTDYGQYGLDDPLCTISLTAGEQSREIKLGDYSQMDSQRYVSVGDGNVYLVSHDPLEEYSTELSDMLRNDTVPVFETVTAVQFTGSSDYRLVWDETLGSSLCATDVYYTDGKPLDTATVTGYLSTLRALTLTDYVSYNATPEELQTYGLDAPEQTVTVEYTAADEDGGAVQTSFTLQIGRSQSEVETGLAQRENGETVEIPAYVRVGDSSILYRISESTYDALMASSYNDLRHQEIFYVDMAVVYQVDVTLEGTTYTLTLEKGKSSEGEDTETWYYQDGEVSGADLRSALTALTASEFTAVQPAQKEEIRLTVYLDSEKFPTVTIALYRYDGSSCLAVVDGQPTALVPRSQVVDLIEAVNGLVL